MTSPIAPDGALTVSKEVRDVLLALATDLMAQATEITEQARDHADGYLEAIEGLGDEFAGQLRLLANGTWGAGTVVTCDTCNDTSEAGWGDQPTCLLHTDPSLICEQHQRTHNGTCPLDHEETA